MLRLVAVSRSKHDISDAVQRFTRYDDSAQCFAIPPLPELQRFKVVVSTCGCAAYLRSSLPKSSDSCWFTHIFVDEAAQAVEAEALVALTLGAPGARRFLAGDFKQLGPVIRSPVAIEYGLDISLMERIVQEITVDHTRVFTLLKSYRAHPSILRLYNRAVYAQLLQCLSGPASRDMERWPDCPRDSDDKPHPVIFHHCNGSESRSLDSPSWMNEEEQRLVMQYVTKLRGFGVKGSDIGIISPYHKQCQRLHYLCEGEGVELEVGTTELYQGREKRVIILSTVRSREKAQIANDLRFSLGFLGNYKRTNVAISRARSLLIVVGNMELLSHDAQWNHIIRLVKELSPECLRGPAFAMHAPVYDDGGGPTANGAAGHGTADGEGGADRPWRDPF